MTLAIKSNMTSREEFATTLRKSKKKQLIEQRRELNFAKSPFEKCDRPRPGSFTRYSKMPPMLLGNLIATQTPFAVMLEKKSYLNAALIVNIPDDQFRAVQSYNRAHYHKNGK